jgi:hypothetical protein
MSFISELEENEELVEFEETWAELVKIEAMGGDSVEMLKTAVKEAAMSDMSEMEEEYVSDTVSDYMNHGV